MFKSQTQKIQQLQSSNFQNNNYVQFKFDNLIRSQGVDNIITMLAKSSVRNFFVTCVPRFERQTYAQSYYQQAKQGLQTVEI